MDDFGQYAAPAYDGNAELQKERTPSLINLMVAGSKKDE